jgi:hypothetical protein
MGAGGKLRVGIIGAGARRGFAAIAHIISGSLILQLLAIRGMSGYSGGNEERGEAG